MNIEKKHDEIAELYLKIGKACKDIIYQKDVLADNEKDITRLKEIRRNRLDQIEEFEIEKDGLRHRLKVLQEND